MSDTGSNSIVNIRQSDIAKELGVSRVTVSKALRDHPDISPEMKRRVLKKAEEMGYIPNLIAMQLNSRKTFNLGIVVPDLENSFFSYAVDSIIDCATDRKYHVILTVSREQAILERYNIENLIGMRVDGLLVCLSQKSQDRQIFSLVKKMNIPLVFFDRAFEDMGLPAVVFDDRRSAINAIDHVIKTGITRIAHFAGYSSVNIGKERIEGYKTSLRNHGIPLRNDWIIEGGFEFKDGYDSFRKLLETGDLPQAVFTVNDRVALGLYKAADEAGLKVPDDIRVFGFGFSETTDLFQPSLTIINQDPRELGRKAFFTLLDMIDNNKVGGNVRIVIEEQFLWRESLIKKETHISPKGI